MGSIGDGQTKHTYPSFLALRAPYMLEQMVQRQRALADISICKRNTKPRPGTAVALICVALILLAYSKNCLATRRRLFVGANRTPPLHTTPQHAARSTTTSEEIIATRFGSSIQSTSSSALYSTHENGSDSTRPHFDVKIF